MKQASRCTVVFATVVALTVSRAQDPQQMRGGTEEVMTMSPFDVESTREKGYRVTDSKTATGIALELAKTPISIQVITSEFIEDLNLDSMHETLRYASGVMIDEFNRDASGVRMRGFQGTTFYRNGVPRSFGVYTDNIDRVEVVKGPVSAFFGQSIPGGIINYITKTPEFRDETRVKLTYGSFDYKRAEIDHQGTLRSYEKLAYRLIGTWQDSDDWRRYEYIKRYYISPQLRWRPSSRLDLTVSYERTRSRENLLNNGRTSLQFHDDWANPLADVIERFRTPGRPTDADVIAFLQNRWNRSINNWATDIQATRGIRPPTVTTGNLSSFYPEGRTYNTGGPGGDKLFETEAIDLALRLNPTDWLDVNYTFAYFDAFVDRYNPFGFPNGDRTIPFQERTDVRWTDTNVHNLDVLITLEAGRTRHRLLFGGQNLEDELRRGSRRMDYSSLEPVMHRGRLLTGRNVALFYDPFNHPEIDVRDLIKEINPKFSLNTSEIRSYYASYQASWFEDRLNTLASVRHERNRTGTSGTVPSFGFNYEFRPGFMLFASRSENFRVNGPNITGPGVLPGEQIASVDPEEAIGTDIGIKTNWRNNTLIGTLTYFTLENQNIRRTDTQRNFFEEPRNQDADPSNNVNWFTLGGLETVEGIELDLTWAPNRNFESVLAASYIWEAKIAADPSLTPGTPEHDLQIGRRLGNTPEYQFKWWNKYTFLSGRLEGVSLGAGVRYFSDTPGATHQPLFRHHNDAYTVLDLHASYRTRFLNRPTTVALTVDNATNHIYQQGLNNVLADPRRIFLNVSTTF